MAAVRSARLVGRGAAFSRLLGRDQSRAALLSFRRRRGSGLDRAPAGCASARGAGNSTRPASRWAAMRCCAGWANRSTQADFVDAACAVSAPLDLAGGGAALSRGLNMLYTRVFLQTLKPKCLQKLEQFPGLFDRERMLARARPVRVRQRRHRAAARLSRHRRLLEPRQRQACAGRHHGADAGAQCAATIRSCRRATCRAAPRRAVTLEYPREGGHVGFATGAAAGRASTGCRGASLHFLEAWPGRMQLRRRRWHGALFNAESTIMDDIVKQAMAKWPNVPHCYGWLALDARGDWRMRDEAARRRGSCRATASPSGAARLHPPQLHRTTSRPLVFPERAAARLCEPGSDALHRAHRSGPGLRAADRRAAGA